jgi:uncharacterized pyridoxal phosphate-containing UPF0001 family protein
VAPELVTGLTADRVARNLAEVREQVANPDVEILAAVKYVAARELGVLHSAGITVAGENRAQELEAKAGAHPEFTWDFIGQLQSRKVKSIVPLVRRIHSVASDSAVKELDKHWRDGLEVFLQVNIAGEEGKAGVPVDEVERYLGRLPFSGLTIMPPQARTPEDSRRWFAAARELATGHGLSGLSMGTTQDFAVAAQEGATIVRIGTRLFR